MQRRRSLARIWRFTVQPLPLISTLAICLVAVLLGGAVAKDGLFGSVTAAWVQALGAVGAVIGAIVVERGSTRRAIELQKKADEAREAARIRAMRHAADVLRYGADRAEKIDLTVPRAEEREWVRTRDALIRARTLIDVYTTPDTDALTTLSLLVVREYVEKVVETSFNFGMNSEAGYKVRAAKIMREAAFSVDEVINEHRQGIW